MHFLGSAFEILGHLIRIGDQRSSQFQPEHTLGDMTLDVV